MAQVAGYTRIRSALWGGAGPEDASALDDWHLAPDLVIGAYEHGRSQAQTQRYLALTQFLIPRQVDPRQRSHNTHLLGEARSLLDTFLRALRHNWGLH